MAASEEHGADWIKKDVERSGIAFVDYEPRSWHQMYFKAFDALQYDRFIGAMGGEGPIYWQALDRYANRLGITGQEFSWFELFMNAVDGEYLKMQREKSDAEEKRKKEQEALR